MMVAALALLLITLGFVLYRDSDFWFPDTQEAVDQEQPVPATAAPVKQTTPSKAERATDKKSHKSKSRRPELQPKITPQPDPHDPSDPPVTATTQRTILPPLEVEVVAGDIHSTLHPGSNSVHVDLQPASPTESASDPSATSDSETAASVTSTASERVQMSADTADIVAQPVQPDYPLLARQMKVQGSVILQALIGSDGIIQDLHILSGPPILATAAQEAVKQWHFKPHYQGADAVETQARITVNFTISTN